MASESLLETWCPMTDQPTCLSPCRLAGQAATRTMQEVPVSAVLSATPKGAAQSESSCACLCAGLRGMAATKDLASGETLVSLPVSAALVVTPKARSALPSSFCSGEFFSKKPW